MFNNDFSVCLLPHIDGNKKTTEASELNMRLRFVISFCMDSNSSKDNRIFLYLIQDQKKAYDYDS